MFSKSSAGPLVVKERRAMAPISRSQLTSALIRFNSPAASKRSSHVLRSANPIAHSMPETETPALSQSHSVPSVFARHCQGLVRRGNIESLIIDEFIRGPAGSTFRHSHFQPAREVGRSNRDSDSPREALGEKVFLGRKWLSSAFTPSSDARGGLPLRGVPTRSGGYRDSPR